MRASRTRSGPIAKGMIATRMRKNTAPTDAPPPMRRAIRHSRTKRARAAAIIGALAASAGLVTRPAPLAPSLSSPAPSRPSGAWVAATISPPPARCSRMIADKARLRGGVERRRRLVEQPERPSGDEEPREGDAPFLARRRARARESRRHGRARPGERRDAPLRWRARHRRPQRRRPRRRDSRPPSARSFSASAWPR